jgi:uncharacterized membrane protein
VKDLALTFYFLFFVVACGISHECGAWYKRRFVEDEGKVTAYLNGVFIIAFLFIVVVPVVAARTVLPSITDSSDVSLFSSLLAFFSFSVAVAMFLNGASD